MYRKIVIGEFVIKLLSNWNGMEPLWEKYKSSGYVFESLKLIEFDHLLIALLFLAEQMKIYSEQSTEAIQTLNFKVINSRLFVHRQPTFDQVTIDC